ncbi:NAD(P)/FAD-dependent oxidoreductase [Flavimarina sp. Hel_I_48]|uniref:NAD(P)/FAD-dependent oxidoreductase n=1 Tax=Flavimarina sp. Hel_I_48 TaxID=1392488 RepID=UPI0004DF63C2|nr:FAD-dependent oxidoreductase [Flavimarina sp. Hel_I_48]
MKKIIIIGAGISGLCSAYYLVKAGFEVSVIDKGDMTTGASYINAGYLTPSHFTTLAEPGMITQGLKWMMNSASPFYIKPRWDTSFFKWTWNFKQSATSSKVERAIPIIKELNLKSRDLYLEIQESGDFDFHMERKGLLMVYKTPKNEEHEIKLAERAQKEGLEVKILNKQELHALEPVFADDVLGGIRYDCDAHTTPHIFMKNMKNWLQQQGVSFKLDEKVVDFKTENNKIKAAVTETNLYEGDEFVLASGAWTFQLAKQLRLNIPIQGGKGYSINVAQPTNITMPAILMEAKCAVTPMQGFTRFAGTMEFSGNNDIIRANRVEAIANAGTRYYKNLEFLQEVKEGATSGLRPVSPDGLPYIGNSAKFANLNVAAGHAMMGWSLGPITGKLITQNIMGEEPELNLVPFKVNRFRF